MLDRSQRLSTPQRRPRLASATRWATILAAIAVPVCLGRGAAASDDTLPFKVGETLVYTFYWNHIPVGDATGRFRKTDKDGNLQFHVAGKTNGAIDKLYKLRFSAVSLVTRDGFRPLKQTLVQQENHRQTRYVIIYNAANGEFFSTKKRLDKEKYREYRFNHMTAFDSVGAFYACRLKPMKAGEKRSVFVAQSKGIYQADLTVGQETTLTVKCGTFAVIPVVMESKRVIPPDEPKKKRPVATLWITADSRRIPIKLSVKTVWGTIWAELKSTPPAPTPVKPQAKAE